MKLWTKLARVVLDVLFFLHISAAQGTEGRTRSLWHRAAFQDKEWHHEISGHHLPEYNVLKHDVGSPSAVSLDVDASHPGRKIPETLFGIFFEEINHAGTGGLDAELVQNRGFEAGGHAMPTTMDPWQPYGSDADVRVLTDLSSCFEKNPVALRIEIVCESCKSGVGVLNPGFWGMNIETGRSYAGSLWIRAATAVDLDVRLTSSNLLKTLASHTITLSEAEAKRWQKVEFRLLAQETDRSARLVLASTKRGTLWLDQVSIRPVDTFKGLGFRKDLAEMLVQLNPGFVRFPGGCYVEGQRLADAFRWRQSVGPRENRPGHWNDVWGYWSDDGLGLFEYLRLAEALQAAPVWVFNNGISHTDEVPTAAIGPFVEDILDGLEFIRGSSTSTWGALRAQMGHPEPFRLRHVAIGNEDCGRYYYHGNYLRFYHAIKAAYPDIHVITNCDATWRPLPHPADLFDFHVYAPAARLYQLHTLFDSFPRQGAKVFASEYAVTGGDSGHRGTLKGALAEAAFMMGLERNSDVVEMASYAPLFVHDYNRRWSPDAIVFDTWRSFGSPSFHVQAMFRHARGSELLPSNLSASVPGLLTSTVRRFCKRRKRWLITIKAVNCGPAAVDLSVRVKGATRGIEAGDVVEALVLESENVMDENSFGEPNKVCPKPAKLGYKEGNVTYALKAHSFVVFDVASTELSTEDQEAPMLGVW